MKLESKQIEFLKWIAILTMVIDHISFIYQTHILKDPYLAIEIRSTIGRIAFPLFSLILVHNFLYFTKNKKKYFKNLFILGLLSQPIFMIFFETTNTLNIFITLLLGLLTINTYINKEKYFEIKLIILFIISFFSDYGLFGLLFIFSIYFLLKYNSYMTLFISFILLILSNITFILHGLIIELIFSSILIYLIYLSSYKIHIGRSKKMFFYFFYPIHLLVIYIIFILYK